MNYIVSILTLYFSLFLTPSANAFVGELSTEWLQPSYLRCFNDGLQFRCWQTNGEPFRNLPAFQFPRSYAFNGRGDTCVLHEKGTSCFTTHSAIWGGENTNKVIHLPTPGTTDLTSLTTTGDDICATDSHSINCWKIYYPRYLFNVGSIENTLRIGPLKNPRSLVHVDGKDHFCFIEGESTLVCQKGNDLTTRQTRIIPGLANIAISGNYTSVYAFTGNQEIYIQKLQSNWSSPLSDIKVRTLGTLLHLIDMHNNELWFRSEKGIEVLKARSLQSELVTLNISDPDRPKGSLITYYYDYNKKKFCAIYTDQFYYCGWAPEGFYGETVPISFPSFFLPTLELSLRHLSNLTYKDRAQVFLRLSDLASDLPVDSHRPYAASYPSLVLRLWILKLSSLLVETIDTPKFSGEITPGLKRSLSHWTKALNLPGTLSMSTPLFRIALEASEAAMEGARTSILEESKVAKLMQSLEVIRSFKAELEKAHSYQPQNLHNQLKLLLDDLMPLITEISSLARTRGYGNMLKEIRIQLGS